MDFFNSVFMSMLDITRCLWQTRIYRTPTKLAGPAVSDGGETGSRGRDYRVLAGADRTEHHAQGIDQIA